MNKIPHPPIRSYVLRQGRLTAAQRRALDTAYLRYGLTFDREKVDLDRIFGRCALRVLEIGFGNGESLLTQASASPEKDFIGIEVHLPGVGHLMAEAERRGLQNLRVFQHDAVEVLLHCIADKSLDGVQIFFPDPWPKKRHQKRRLIQPDFVALLAHKLKVGGRLHCATDWAHYTEQMLEVLSVSNVLENAADDATYYSDPYSLRPLTKFEQRGLRLGHQIRDLVFVRI